MMLKALSMLDAQPIKVWAVDSNNIPSTASMQDGVGSHGSAYTQSAEDGSLQVNADITKVGLNVIISTLEARHD